MLVKAVLDGNETKRVARAVTCNFEEREISVEDAIALRSSNRKNIGFYCIECGKLVRPHKGSSYGAAHFEHLRRNPKCRLSDPER